MSVMLPVLKGASRTFDMFGSAYKLRKNKLLHVHVPSDSKAIHSDWTAVGNDLFIAVERYKGNGK